MLTRQHSDRRTAPWTPAAALLVAIALSGCYSGYLQADGDSEGSDEGADDGAGEDSGAPQPDAPAALDGPGECVDTRTFFRDEVFRPVLQAKCYACHNDKGAAKGTDFILRGDDYPGYLEANYNTLANLARLEIDGKPLVLRKPTLDGVEHGGGARFEVDSPDYKALERMIELFQEPIHCAVNKEVEAYFQGLVLLDDAQTLRKASVLLADRLPTPEELALVEQEGAVGLDLALNILLYEDAFYARIKSIYNDRLLTDAYLPGRRALDLLDPQLAPTKMTIFANDAARRRWANEAIAREPLNLIEHVLREPGAPFSEILSADYTMINPFSAQVYGLNPAELGFQDPADPREFIPYNFEGIPEAGLLTSVAFLARYPDTPTNRARARARFAFDFFLGVDVQQLAARAIDIDDVQGTNPTLFDANCNVCHHYIDPVAGAFRNYSYEGWYRPDSQWFGDMVPPGYADEVIDSEGQTRALPWLAERLAVDDGFAMSVVYTVYQGLTGDAPLRQPLDASDQNYLAKVRAFDAQDYSFKKLAHAFNESNHDLRVLIKEMVKTPWFRAIDYTGDPSPERLISLAPMGSSRSLSPELLDRKIVAAVGFPWMRGDTSALAADANYKFFYGGIDSLNTTTRLKELNGVMNNIAERMANELACRATAPEFSRPAEQRLLFPYVELGDEPTVGLGKTRVRQNIQHLHERLLGERLQAGDPELERSLQLFTVVLEDGRAGLESGDYPVALPVACRGTFNPITGEAIEDGIVEDADYKIRAWMAVLTYLLGDYEFLYE